MNKLRIGLLKCDRFIPEIRSKYGDIDVQFRNLLSLNTINPNWELNVFECKEENQFPSHSDIVDKQLYSGFIISGSRSSVNDDNDWTNRLKDTIKLLHQKSINTVGVCYGHQAISSVLGGKISDNPKGWSVSQHAINIDKDVLKPYDNSVFKPFGGLDSIGRNLDIICSNKQLVSTTPLALKCFAHSDQCSNHGSIGDNFITFQGHPEYTGPLIKDIILGRRGLIPDDVIEAGVEMADRSNIDRAWYANLIISFIMNNNKTWILNIVAMATNWYYVNASTSYGGGGYSYKVKYYFKFNSFKESMAAGQLGRASFAFCVLTFITLIVEMMFIILSMVNILSKIPFANKVPKFLPIISVLFSFLSVLIFIGYPNAMYKDCEKMNFGCDESNYKFVNTGNYQSSPYVGWCCMLVNTVILIIASVLCLVRVVVSKPKVKKVPIAIEQPKKKSITKSQVVQTMITNKDNKDDNIIINKDKENKSPTMIMIQNNSNNGQLCKTTVSNRPKFWILGSPVKSYTLSK
ncbi:glutamine amidotransferase class-I domain-containing protein [Cavenderia fasciculata]|uniref:Glutamine amidotransferase class-I domain-containing protein n=1 Tax=Cavenderia fasciculata TaxID=261658 RepID=F4Q208_CACFS|nr:glutamine amidotransferase class-I domain-containing protein [Cavenderia fasciculata]EGG18028.1 glutamine amidotransferase class-I domain-containing protein [Cavenderia fasciculata]|eukprot:XP_004356921.1 glutamine amidotransferase class-I domain-containing protein [Cavenderia fasciculata]